uniref:RING-type domain-containing protein n=1 Tax=Florenciella sp. virus SA2 TaxID=3240092 RepID=A0AB39J6C2_9VIRU
MNYYFNNGYQNNRNNNTNSNSNASSSNSASASVPVPAPARNNNYLFNNGYNVLPLTPTPTPATTPISTPTSMPNISSHIQHNYLNSLIDVSINNTLGSNEYYSSFAYNDLDINFYHNTVLDENNASNIINHLLENLNNEEVNNLINNIYEESVELEQEATNENAEEIINIINNNMVDGIYEDYKSQIKNHSCPILLQDFNSKEKITIFKLCNHAISNITKDKFIKSFTKCPLCNSNLLS